MVKEVVNPLVQQLEKEITDAVLNPLFDKLKERRPNKSRRYHLQTYMRKLWVGYFKAVSNYGTVGEDDPIVIDKEKVDILQPVFLEAADLISSHPNFSWQIQVGGERIGKPSWAMTDSIGFLDDLIPKSKNNLKTGLIDLIEETW